MAIGRIWLQTFCSAVLALSIIQSGRSQTSVPPILFTGPLSGPQREFLTNKNTSDCLHSKAYALGNLGDDPKLCKWVADTIPAMIQPASWKQGDARMCYDAPLRILAVSTTPDVHAQIEEFLEGIKRSLPPQKKLPQHEEPIMRVQYVAPVSPPMPKHLLHFIVRYEGAGVIDANVAKLGSLPFPLLINRYSSDPMIRLEKMMIDSENLRQMHDEWRQFWMKDQPTHLTPYRIHGGVGPASSRP